MSDKVDRYNYDVVSIKRSEQAKPTNYIQDGMHIEQSRIRTSGQFIKVFADIFLAKQAGGKSYL